MRSLRQVAPTNLTNLKKHAAKDFAENRMTAEQFKQIAESCSNLMQIIESVISENQGAQTLNENENSDQFPRLQGVENASVRETRPYRKREKAVVGS
jgi:hypothetical protein